MVEGMKVKKSTLIVGGVALLGVAFLVIGVLMTDKWPTYYAHSLRNWQEADAVAGYPMVLDEEAEEPEFWTAEFQPGLHLFLGIERYRMPLAEGFSNPLGDLAVIEEKTSGGVRMNSAGGGVLGIGDMVYAAGTGVVLYAGKAEGLPGMTVVLGHRLGDGRIVTTRYSRIGEVTVRVGSLVARGDGMGELVAEEKVVGLDFEVREAVGIDLRESGKTLEVEGFMKEQAVGSRWPDAAKVLTARNKGHYSEVLQMDSESAEILADKLGGEEE